MVLDTTFFGYGAGLVMAAFIAGICVNAVVTGIRSVR